MGVKIRGITVEIGGDTTGLEKSLKSVNTEIKDTQKQLRDVEKLLKIDPSNTELLAQKQRLLKEAISETKEKLDALKQEQEQAKQQLESGELGQDKYDALQREIIETEDNLKSLESKSGEAEAALKRLGDVASGASVDFEKLAEKGKLLETTGDKITGIGKKVSVASAAVAGVGAVAVKTTADFDAQMSKVSAISGATGEDFEALRAKAREMGAATKFSASEAGEAFEYMAMAGWKTRDMVDGISGIMNLAAASGEDLATTSDIVTDALTAFGLSAADSGHFADILAAASSNANTNVSMMGETFKYAAPVAGALGFSAEDTAEAIGLMANAGIKSSQAGTALRKILTELNGEVKIHSEELGDVVINTVNADGSMRGLSDILADCREAFSHLSESEQASNAETLVGKNALSGFLALMNAAPSDVSKLQDAITNCTYDLHEISATLKNSGVDWQKYADKAWMALGSGMEGLVDEIIWNLSEVGTSAEDLQQYLMMEYDLDAEDAIRTIETVQSSMASSTGVAKQMAETMQDNLSGQITILKSQLEELMISFGDMLMPIIMKAVTAVQNFVDKLNNMSSVSRGIILIIGSIVAAAGPLLIIVGTLMSSVGKVMQGLSKFSGPINLLVGYVKNAGGVFKALGTSIAGIPAPILAAVAVIAVLASAFRHLWNTNEEFRTKITEIWSGIAEKITGFVDTIKERFSGLGERFSQTLEPMRQLWDTFCNSLGPVFEGVFSLLSVVLGTVLDTLIGILDVFIGVFTGNWSQAWQGIREILTGVWEGVTGAISVVLETIRGIVDNFLSTFGTNWNTLWTGVVTTVSTIWETIKSVVQVELMFLGELIKTAFNIITIPFRLIWENCKTEITTAWGTIQTTISDVLTAVKSNIEAVLTPVKQFIITKWTEVKTVTQEKWQEMNNTISEKLDGIKTSVDTVFTSVKDFISSTFGEVSGIASQKWNEVKQQIMNPMNEAKSHVENAVNAMRNIFNNCHLQLPHISLPHFSISGSFSLDPPSVPHFSIDWYKKAMDDGMILNGATIFGAAGGKLLGGGEAGPEAIVGVSSLMGMIQNAVKSIGAPSVNMGGININIYATESQSAHEIAEEVEQILNHKVMRQGAVFM